MAGFPVKTGTDKTGTDKIGNDKTGNVKNMCWGWALSFPRPHPALILDISNPNPKRYR